jgi:hypothetical protein
LEIELGKVGEQQSIIVCDRHPKVLAKGALFFGRNENSDALPAC